MGHGFFGIGRGDVKEFPRAFVPERDVLTALRPWTENIKKRQA